ncbi:MAG: hypothetical protein QNJ36_03120 [Calothrix sp. MO_167.B42]|nr:hypothetical protein [Calothrix sp. MO_167.B42]
MGILSNVTKIANNIGGGHAIDRNKVLGATGYGVVNPSAPGNWSSIRSVPVLHEPGYFNKDEADMLRELAKDRTQGAKQTARAMNSLGKIEQADAAVHKAHKNYLGVVADGELTKVRSNAKLARKLHGQRSSYVHLDESLQRAEAVAEQRIQQLQQRIRESY